MVTKISKAPSSFSFSRKDDLDNYTKSVKSDSCQRMNDTKFRVLRCLLKPYIKDASILDLGCGNAFYLDSLFEDGLRSYTGIDISQLMIDLVKVSSKRKNNVRLIVGDMVDENLILDNFYGCVLSIFSLMKIKSINRVFKIVNKKIKKGGIFLIMTNTYITKNLELKNFMVKIKKNDRVIFSNYPRSADQFIKTAKKYEFTLLCNFSKPFSKEKIITSPNSKKISGFDTILMFEKE